MQYLNCIRLGLLLSKLKFEMLAQGEYEFLGTPSEMTNAQQAGNNGRRRRSQVDRVILQILVVTMRVPPRLIAFNQSWRCIQRDALVVLEPHLA